MSLRWTALQSHRSRILLVDLLYPLFFGSRRSKCWDCYIDRCLTRNLSLQTSTSIVTTETTTSWSNAPLNKRQVTKQVPIYVSSACVADVTSRYISACSCLGVTTIPTVYAPTPITTTTAYVTVSITQETLVATVSTATATITAPTSTDV